MSKLSEKQAHQKKLLRHVAEFECPGPVCKVNRVGRGAMQSRSTQLSAELPGSDQDTKFHSDILALPHGVHLRWMKLGFQTSKHNCPVPEVIVSRN